MPSRCILWTQGRVSEVKIGKESWNMLRLRRTSFPLIRESLFKREKVVESPPKQKTETVKVEAQQCQTSCTKRSEESRPWCNCDHQGWHPTLDGSEKHRSGVQPEDGVRLDHILRQGYQSSRGWYWWSFQNQTALHQSRRQWPAPVC